VYQSAAKDNSLASANGFERKGSEGVVVILAIVIAAGHPSCTPNDLVLHTRPYHICALTICVSCPPWRPAAVVPSESRALEGSLLESWESLAQFERLNRGRLGPSDKALPGVGSEVETLQQAVQER
jgi:hypothetical protein